MPDGLAVPLLGAWGLPGVVVAVLLLVYLLPQIPGKWKYRNGNGRDQRVDTLLTEFHQFEVRTSREIGELNRDVRTAIVDIGVLSTRMEGIGSKIAAQTQATVTRIEDRFERDVADVRLRLDRLEDRREP